MALAATVVMSILVGTVQVRALELGALQAVPSSSPPYIFRLPVIASSPGPSAIAAVVVRQPPGALSFVKRNVVELRLQALTDVELEVSHGGQTLNRLLLKSELRAARTQLDPVLPSNASQRLQGRDGDQPLAEALPPTPASAEAPQRALLERELEEVRQEFHNLLARVTPWQGFAPPAGAIGERTRAIGLALMLGGGFITGIVALVMGYRRQRHACNLERWQRRALTLSKPSRQDRCGGDPPRLLTVQPALWSQAAPGGQRLVTILRRVRVSQKRRRRFRVPTPGHMANVAQELDAEPVRRVAQTSQRGPSTPAELLEALTQLRRELMRLQGRSHPGSTAKPPEVSSGRSRR